MSEENPLKNVRLWHKLFHAANWGRRRVKTSHKHLRSGGVHLEIAYSSHSKLQVVRVEFRVARRFKIEMTASPDFMHSWTTDKIKLYGSSLTLYGKQTTSDVERYLTDILLHME